MTLLTPPGSRRPVSGVYALWSPDSKSVYVGESQDVYARREDYDVAIRLGCRWKFIRPLKRSATKMERLRAEAEVAQYLELCGVRVVSKWVENYADHRRPARRPGARTQAA